MFDRTILTQVVVSGLCMGFVYALVAVGLTIVFSLMQLVNFAHGEFLMIAMYMTFWAYSLFGIDPLYFVPFNALLMFAFGALIYRQIVRRIIHVPPLNQIFTTWGLIIFFQNAAQFLWTPDYRRVADPLAEGRIELAGAFFSRPQVIAGVVALIAFLGLYLLMMKTRMGKAMRATAQDRQAAALMAIDTDKMFLLGVGLGTACVGVAGALLANYVAVHPWVGFPYVLTCFVVVALGGFGSVTGTLVAAVIVGIIESLAGFFLNPTLKRAIVYAIFMLVVAVRPRGLMGKR
jgi:branched-chain amino acid transport system permease protein